MSAGEIQLVLWINVVEACYGLDILSSVLSTGSPFVTFSQVLHNRFRYFMWFPMVQLGSHAFCFVPSSCQIFNVVAGLFNPFSEWRGYGLKKGCWEDVLSFLPTAIHSFPANQGVTSMCQLFSVTTQDLSGWDDSSQRQWPRFSWQLRSNWLGTKYSEMFNIFWDSCRRVRKPTVS